MFMKKIELSAEYENGILTVTDKRTSFCHYRIECFGGKWKLFSTPVGGEAKYIDCYPTFGVAHGAAMKL